MKSWRKGIPGRGGYKDTEAEKPWHAQEQRDGGRRVVRRMIWGEFREEAGARSCRALEAAVRAWILFGEQEKPLADSVTQEWQSH